VTAKEIKDLAAAAGVTGAAKQLPFLVILPIKSLLAYVEVELLWRARAHRTQRDLATVGTPHFAQFVPLGNNRVGFFTVYDGTARPADAEFVFKPPEGATQIEITAAAANVPVAKAKGGSR
jgi:hypothetical protein